MLAWLISSSVLIVIVILLRYFLKGKISLRLQYALWALVLLRLLIPVNFGNSVLSVMNAVPSKTVAVSTGVHTSEKLNVPVLPAPLQEEVPVTKNIMRDRAGTTKEEVMLTSLTKIVKGVWLVGLTLVGLSFSISNWRFALQLKKDRQVLLLADSRLPVYVSSVVKTPCLFGILRPAIYLTEEAVADKAVLRYSIAHETSHFYHGDHLWALLRGLSLALHWYNPLVCWAAVLSMNDAELACDEATIRRIGEDERATYGRTIINMTCQSYPALLSTATTMMGSKNSLKERITLIAKRPKMAVYTLLIVLFILVAVAACTFTGAVDTAKLQQEASSAGEGTVPTISSADELAGAAVFSPVATLDSLFASKGVTLTLSHRIQEASGEGMHTFNTYPLSDWYYERFKVLLGNYKWEKIADPSLIDVDYVSQLSATSGDGLINVFFWQDSGAGVLEYHVENVSTFWQATATNGADSSIAQDIRMEYDNLDVDSTRIAFRLDESAESAAKYFISDAYPTHMANLAPGNVYGFSAYTALEWGVREVSEDGNAVVGWFKYAFTPWDFNSPGIWAGNTTAGTGEYAGKLTRYNEFVLQKQEDGYWHCLELGTGGLKLPELKDGIYLLSADPTKGYIFFNTKNASWESAPLLAMNYAIGGHYIIEDAIVIATSEDGSVELVLEKKGEDGLELVSLTCEDENLKGWWKAGDIYINTDEEDGL